MGTRAECRKFAPNIFNKSKCSHCFRQREEHSAAALECNRSTRKVSKCGYLFVAPDWDFSNPLYRTKRWQRRWFVLYDDGELTYSVDEHPDTVPQAIVDMTKVLEVTTAEDVTSHPNSIAITAPDRVTFVKGTCPEEAKWWLNILAAFPKQKGRHKRNATFPGGQTTTIIQSQTMPVGRNRHNSYHKDTLQSPISNIDSISQSWNNTTNLSSNENNINANNENNNNNSNNTRVYSDQPVSSQSPPTRDKLHPEGKAQTRNRNRNRTSQDTTDTGSPCLLIEDVIRDEKLKDIANTLTNLSQHSSNRWSSTTCSPEKPSEEKPTRDENTIPAHNTIQMRPKSLPISPNAPSIVSAIVKKIPSTVETQRNSSLKQIQQQHQQKQLLQHQKQQLQQQQQSNGRTQQHERGDPDGGCVVDEPVNYLAKNSELRVNLPSEDLLHSKKGWLMKQDVRSGDWSKHWFTLRGAALFFYRDPVAEDRGVLDGVLDVNSITGISEVPVPRNFGFQLATWDNRRIILSTVTASIRNNWINVLKSAAGLPMTKVTTPCQTENISIIDNHTPVEISEKQQTINTNNEIILAPTSEEIKTKRTPGREFVKAQKNQENIYKSKILSNSTALTSVTSSPTTLKPLQLSSDEEYRTASEGGRRDSVDWGSPNSPSPPIPMSLARTKDKIRSRSNSRSRLHKRSHSSPPTSRRSTIDSVVSDDFPNINTVHEEVFLDKELQLRLQAAEKELTLLRDETHEREARMSELLATMERTEVELTLRRREAEEVKDSLTTQLTESRSSAQEMIERLTVELDRTREANKDLEDRLSRGIEENESLYKRLRDLTSGLDTTSHSTNLSRNKMKRMDSLSDLTKLNEINPAHLDKEALTEEYNDLRARFERVVTELKAMKRELKESHSAFDSLEIAHETLQREYERKKNEDAAQSKMMAARIQDLTAKYTNAEKQVRTLKQKLLRADKRRTLSLKGKESMTIQKELEEKVVELEAKIESWETTNPDTAMSSPRASPPRSDSSADRSAKKDRLRRKSLESPTNQPMQILCRLNALEKKIDHTSNTMQDSNKTSAPEKYADHLVERLKNLETVVLTSRNIVEQSLQQFQSLKSSRSRRSVSPMPDKKDSFRFVERCLGEVSKILRDSCDNCIGDDASSTTNLEALSDTSPIKLALTQLEAQLRTKLSDLLKQRRMLRETESLSQRKDLELLAERIAFESVCFGKLNDALNRSNSTEDFGENQTRSEIAETAQLMTILKAKLNGKCSIKPTGNTDVLASVLARRLILTAGRTGQLKLPVHSNINSQIMDDLLRQQNELNMIANRYKTNAIENLAYGLAAETLSYISSNDAVQGAVQEAWRQAQEQVNAELIQSEITHIMMKNSQRLGTSLAPSFGYTLTPQERVSFENFADAVQDALRKEMDVSINQLIQCYEETLAKMKRGQWRLHVEQERKPSEGRQLLAEFADVVAHKALVDARISVLKGDYTSKDFSTNSSKENHSSIASLQKYENLFSELASEFGVESADDILAEADFNFMYKYFTTEFMTNRADIKEVSSVLGKLEESILMLQSTMNPKTNTTVEHFENDTLHSICDRTNELQHRVEVMIANARSLVTRCAEYDSLQDAIIQVTNQHDQDMSDMKQNYEESLHNLSLQIHEHKQLQRSLENEKNEILEQVNNVRNKLRVREKDLNTTNAKLLDYETMCHDKNKENQELIESIEEESEKTKMYRNKYDEILEKFSKLSDELVDLEKERDYIFEQMEKEQSRCKSFEKHLEMLGSEHAQQIDNLHAAYREQQLSGELMDAERDQNADETTRGRYQEEIEQLRTLCEKGLAAMESSHKKIILELEAKHEDEIQKLMCEKEQALAEETQATLAALDAMRKAHQNEVQREIARFKQDFVKQFQKSGQPSSYKERDQELEEVRQEILSLSEKYSIKCVEAASLDEKYRIAQQQLKISQQHIQQLDSRNQTLRAYLVKDDSKYGSNSKTTTHVDEIASTTTISNNENPKDIQLLNNKKEKYPRLKYNEGPKLNVPSLYQSPSIEKNNLNDINCKNIDNKVISTKTFNLNLLNYNRSLNSDDNNNNNINSSNKIDNKQIDDGNDMKLKKNSIQLTPSTENLCSPPPNNGKDAEHQQIHRFELEI